jgi:hypothetical protein
MSSSSAPSGPTISYPLSMIFIVTAICAVLLAMLRSVVLGLMSREIREGEVLAAIFGLGFCGAFLGWWIGTYHRFWLSGALAGALGGAVAGGMTGPLLLVRADELAGMWCAIVGGSLLLVTAGLVMRYSSAAEPRPPYLAAWEPPTVSATITRDTAPPLDPPPDAFESR